MQQGQMQQGQIVAAQGGRPSGVAPPGGGDPDGDRGGDSGSSMQSDSEDDDPDAGSSSDEVQIVDEINRGEEMFMALDTYMTLFGDFDKARNPKHKKVTIQGNQGILVPVDDSTEFEL
eukprot:578119-Pyramimonas_sp.AAC.1